MTKETVETARKAHNTSPVATAALGRLLTAGAMMGVMMKGDKDILTPVSYTHLTDKALRKALKEHTKNATTIIVAQRISTILNADQILVLDDGKMAGLGTHRELMENCEVYRQIAMSQLSEEELSLIHI